MEGFAVREGQGRGYTISGDLSNKCKNYE